MTAGTDPNKNSSAAGRGGGRLDVELALWRDCGTWQLTERTGQSLEGAQAAQEAPRRDGMLPTGRRMPLRRRPRALDAEQQARGAATAGWRKQPRTPWLAAGPRAQLLAHQGVK